MTPFTSSDANNYTSSSGIFPDINDPDFFRIFGVAASTLWIKFVKVYRFKSNLKSESFVFFDNFA